MTKDELKEIEGILGGLTDRLADCRDDLKALKIFNPRIAEGQQVASKLLHTAATQLAAAAQKLTALTSKLASSINGEASASNLCRDPRRVF